MVVLRVELDTIIAVQHRAQVLGEDKVPDSIIPIHSSHALMQYQCNDNRLKHANELPLVQDLGTDEQTVEEDFEVRQCVCRA